MKPPRSSSKNSVFVWAVRPLAFILCLAVLSLSFSAVPADAARKKKASTGNPLYAAIVMDADTGLILHQSNADKALHPASLTKIMTLMLTFEALESGKLSLRDRIPISRHAASMQPSKLGLSPGSSIRVEDAIYAVVTKSANDIAAALGEAVGGTESGFARLMTRRAHEIGMSRTRFTNASGLNDPSQVTSARDMAKLARYIILTYPQYYPYFSKSSFKYNGVSHRNHNRLMETYKGMDGMKTGYVNASGFNLVASAVRNNHRLIGVVFGGRSAPSRNAQMAKLLDEGFANLNDIRVAQDSIPLPARKPDRPGQPALLASAGAYAEPGAVPSQAAQAPAAVGPMLAQGMFGMLIGEGDYDPAAARRIETGLSAIAAHKGEAVHETRERLAPAVMKASLSQAGKRIADHFSPGVPAQGGIQQAAYTPPAAISSGRWAIQIGAYTSRAVTDLVLNKAREKLPPELGNASPLVVPVQTADGWLFRARLAGFSKSEATRACAGFRDCIVIEPGT